MLHRYNIYSKISANDRRFLYHACILIVRLLLYQLIQMCLFFSRLFLYFFFFTFYEPSYIIMSQELSYCRVILRVLPITSRRAERLLTEIKVRYTNRTQCDISYNVEIRALRGSLFLPRFRSSLGMRHSSA